MPSAQASRNFDIGTAFDTPLAGQALADSYSVVFRSPHPDDVYCYTPGLIAAAAGRLIATFDLGGDGVVRLPGPKGSRASGTRFGMGKVFASADDGLSWQEKATFPFWHARPFRVGGRIFVLGHAGDIRIISSSDDGETWSAPAQLTSGMKWHGSACNVHYHNDHVYLALDERKDLSIAGWNTAGLAPRVLRAKLDSDLLNPASWAISEAQAFNEVLSADDFDFFGVPYFNTPARAPTTIGPGRQCAPMGWLEPNLVQFQDPAHIWHDPTGRTLHVFLRTNTGGTGFAALVKVKTGPDGRMVTEFETMPSGARATFIPFPGGHLKFFMLFDTISRLYWLLSSQATDSMTRADDLPPERYNLANNERHRLQLHFSKNCIDWCFAGLVTAGKDERHARNYASMAILGDDLGILCRSGDNEARDSQYTNLITFHRIENFRRLAY